ncbi:hypothetical protein H5203_21560 [Pseudoalteromonas sp. SG41-1]|uniref:hypothetical protein n=1 Tax=Pseudoalteromonas sp. SG41-1 TaxID=2760979 RepID=UPI0016006360|nr:hypothetical protein [Pseudoalteromonas sp. SG41-1]MBB1508033.1 hypothetical protein [Pseudoalteromonas sp. SG41-1]
MALLDCYVFILKYNKLTNMNIKFEDAKKIYNIELAKFYSDFKRYKCFDNSKPIMSVLYNDNWEVEYQKLEELRDQFNNEGHYSRVIQPPKLVYVDAGTIMKVSHSNSQSVKKIEANNLYQVCQIIMSQKAPLDEKQRACKHIEALAYHNPDIYKQLSFRKFGSGYYCYYSQNGENRMTSIGTGIVVNCDYKYIKKATGNRATRSDKKSLIDLKLFCSGKGYLYQEVI